MGMNVKRRVLKPMTIVAELLRKYWKEAAYYACVGIVLCAVAWAAEAYRTDKTADAAALPAAEVSESSDVPLPEISIPEDMCLIRGYCDAPVWNGDLRQWENHAAQDYAAADAAVKAFCGGTVGKIGSDPRCGNYLEIVSGDLKLVYGSVSANEDIKTGDAVQAGDIIGTADGSLLREAYMQPHLHLEAYYKGRNTDIAFFL